MTTHFTTIHHLFIVDTSTRSAENKSQLISQVNDSIDSIRLANKGENHAHRMTIMSIVKNRVTCVFHDVEISDTGSFNINNSDYNEPVQLFDAIGTSIAIWRALGHHRVNQGKHQVSIFTAGKDHGSRKYTICTLKTIITSLREIGWHFTLVGAHPLLPRIAANIGIPNYYNCSPRPSYRDRNFLISRLKKQWHQQQSRKIEEIATHKAA